MDLRFCDVQDLNEISKLHCKKQARKPKCIITKREADAYKEFEKLLTRHFDVLTRSVSCMDMKELQSLKSPHEIFANHCVIYTSMERKRYSSLVLFQAMSKNSFASMHTLEEMMAKDGARGTTNGNGMSGFTLANCSLREKMPSCALSASLSNDLSTISLHSSSEGFEDEETLGIFDDKSTYFSEYSVKDEERNSQVHISSLSTASSHSVEISSDEGTYSSLENLNDEKTHSVAESFNDEGSQSMSKPQTNSQVSLLTQRSFPERSLMYDTDDSGFKCLPNERARGRSLALKKSISGQDIRTQYLEGHLHSQTQSTQGFFDDLIRSPKECFKVRTHSSEGCFDIQTQPLEGCYIDRAQSLEDILNKWKVSFRDSSLKTYEKTSKNPTLESLSSCSVLFPFAQTTLGKEEKLVASLHGNTPKRIYNEEFETPDLAAAVADRTFLFFQETPWYKPAESFKRSESWSFSLDRSIDHVEAERNATLAQSVSWECVSAGAFEELFSPSNETQKTSSISHAMKECSVAISDDGRNVNLARSISWDCISEKAFAELFSQSDYDNKEMRNSLVRAMPECSVAKSNTGKHSNIVRSISWEYISTEALKGLFSPSERRGKETPNLVSTISQLSITASKDGRCSHLARSISWNCISTGALKELFSSSDTQDQGAKSSPCTTHSTSERSIATLNLLFTSASSQESIVSVSSIESAVSASPPVSICLHGSEMPTRSVSTIIPRTTMLEIISSRLSLSSVDDFGDISNGSTSSLSMLPKSTTLESISSSSSLSSVDDFGNKIKRSTSSLLFIPCASNLRRFKTWTDLTDETIFTGSDDGINEMQCEHGNDGKNINEEETQDDENAERHSLENGEHLKGYSQADNQHLKTRSLEQNELRKGDSLEASGYSLAHGEHLKGYSLGNVELLEEHSLKNADLNGHSLINVDKASKGFHAKKSASNSDISCFISDDGLFDTTATTPTLSYKSLKTTADSLVTATYSLATAEDGLATSDGRNAKVAQKRCKIIRSFKKRLCYSFRKLCCWKN